MKRGAVPKRILTVREFREYSPWDTPRYRVVDAVRVLRAWLADPSVPDELRAHLVRDIGPEQLASGGDWLLRSPLARTLARGLVDAS